MAKLNLTVTDKQKVDMKKAALINNFKTVSEFVLSRTQKDSAKDKEIARLNAQVQILEFSALEQWSNDVCRGYVIKAMKNKDFSEDQIQKVIYSLSAAFDNYTLEQAKQEYINSSY